MGGLAGFGAGVTGFGAGFIYAGKKEDAPPPFPVSVPGSLTPPVPTATARSTEVRAAAAPTVVDPFKKTQHDAQRVGTREGARVHAQALKPQVKKFEEDNKQAELKKREDEKKLQEARQKEAQVQYEQLKKDVGINIKKEFEKRKLTSPIAVMESVRGGLAGLITFLPGESLEQAHKRLSDKYSLAAIAGINDGIAVALLGKKDMIKNYKDKFFVNWIGPVLNNSVELQEALGVKKAEFEYDALAVLGEGLISIRSNFLPGDGAKERVGAGIIAWREGIAPALVMSGGTSKGLEGESMFAYTENDEMIKLFGSVPQWAQDKETKSITTVGNIKYLKEKAEKRGWRKMCIVTNRFHKERAELLCRIFDLEARVVAAEDLIAEKNPKLKPLIEEKYQKNSDGTYKNPNMQRQVEYEQNTVHILQASLLLGKDKAKNVAGQMEDYAINVLHRT